MSDMIVVKGIKKVYYNKLKEPEPVFDNLSVEFGIGEITCILGKSGCGKSTLINMLTGYESITEGSIYLKESGEKIDKKDFSIIFQENTLFPWKTVIQNLEFGFRMKGIAKKEARERAYHSLKRFNLEKTRDFYPRELSGGMYEKISILRAFINDSKFVVLDEAFNALDYYSKKEVQDFILNLHNERKFTAILITHDIDEAIRLSDQICILSGYPNDSVFYIRNELAIPREYNDSFYSLKKSIIDKLGEP